MTGLVSGSAHYVCSGTNNMVNELRIPVLLVTLMLFSPTQAHLAAMVSVAVNIPGFAYFGKTPFSVVDRIEDQSAAAG